SIGREIYKLHKDSSEERIYSIEEIKRHKGFFGITKDEWATTQVLMLKEGVKGVAGGIDRWSKFSSPEAAQEAKRKRAMEMQKSINTGSVTQSPKENQVSDEELQAIGAGDCCVIAEDDIGYAAIENHKWLETALLTFFKQTRFKPVNMPFFVSNKEFTITAEMKKINSLMGSYCAGYVTSILENENIKQKNPKTGKYEYKVRTAVELVCNAFSVRHIVYALNDFWPDIKVPGSIKKAFERCFGAMRKTLITKPKKESPDEQFARLKVAEETKTAGNTNENNDSSKGAPAQDGDNERNAEIYYIIESYKKSTAAKPKKPPNTLPPILPPTPLEATKRTR
ncbi:MAG: hypothetical protein FWF79_01210, partial [Defluviitaleaceae bacterium]|nr:hypothetical protein [Defluviitaleaceae bacterium]